MSIWFAAPASALTINFPSVPSTGTRGSDYTFTAKISITDDELLPIQGVDLEIYNTADSSYTLTCSDLPLSSTSKSYTPSGGGTVTVSASTTKWEYQYGYGYALWQGEGYYFNYTYGYGYSGATASITYSITWTSPTSWPTGSANKAKLTITANSNTFTKTSDGFTLSPPAAGAGGGAAGGAPSGTTYVYDATNSAGEFTRTVTAKSDDRNVELTINKGTIGKTRTGSPLTKITITEDPDPPAPPADAEIIGLAYDLGPDGATFEPPIDLTFEYDPDDLPAGVEEKNLKLAYWDGSDWVILECTVDTAANTITAEVSHFTEFTVMALTSPAAFTVDDLAIAPDEVDIDQKVAISATVTNTGDLSGSYTVTLKVDGAVVDTKTVSLDGGASQKVTFTTAQDAAGTYSVDVDGLTGTFTVKAPLLPEPFNWWLIGGVIAAVVVASVVVVMVVRRRRA